MSKKGKKRKKGGVGCLIAVLILIAALAAVGAGFMWLNSENVSPKGADTEAVITVNINDGETVGEIIHSLKTAGVIDSELHFKYLCKKTDSGAGFKSGSYEFTSGMSFSEIVEKLNTGAMSADTYRFTVREGMWLKEIAAELEADGICSAEEFIAAANSRDYDYSFVADIPDRDNLLEGYLFPDTYFIEKTASAEDIVNMMLADFEKNFDAELAAKAGEQGRSVDDIVKVASLIEAEVKYPPERATVASVIYNRIAQNMRLQIDASVLYAMGERKGRVYEKDLQMNDPHNTYVIKGLPSGPIGNPGKACLEAAVNPEKTDYLYYVLKDSSTGQHTFSADYQTFLKDKENYLASK